MKLHLLIPAAMLLFSSCGQQKATEEAANMEVNRERDSLIELLNQRDASINDFLSVNSEIERNLDSVVAREGAIKMTVMKETDVAPSMKDRINSDILTINNLMKENRQKINELNSKLRKTNGKLAENAKMIEHLNARLNEKNSELEALNEQLSSLKVKVASLETSVNTLIAENEEQSKVIELQTTTLHMAYYIIGKSKDLRDKKIISKTGGLLGMGKTSQIDPNIDNSKFIQIDYTKISELSLNTEKVKIITTHSVDSYILGKDQDNKAILKIKNPEKFWSASKYLVIVND